MNCSVLQQLLNSCLRSSAQYVVFRFHLQEELRMQCVFSGGLYLSGTAAVWTDFATLTGERAQELCYSSCWVQCPLTWKRAAAENSLTAQKEKGKGFFFFPFSKNSLTASRLILDLTFKSLDVKSMCILDCICAE